jgi:hypothetical protein
MNVLCIDCTMPSNTCAELTPQRMGICDLLYLLPPPSPLDNLNEPRCQPYSTEMLISHPGFMR